MKAIFYILLSALCISSINHPAYAESFDQELKLAMAVYGAPVVSYAIIDHNEIVKVKTLSWNYDLPVREDALFQAASISKSLSSYAALYLVAQGYLTLDDNINNYLTSWQLPVNKFNEQKPVTLYQLMSMTSGLLVQGFAGYRQGSLLPNALDILKGQKPANNPPVVSIFVPGTKQYYSGGGFQVLQQITTDVTGVPFPQFMNQLILPEIGMENSIFQFPLTDTKALTHVVAGFEGWSATMIPSGWQDYQCFAAGGMWSTAKDLAMFLIDVSNSYTGKHSGLIPKALAHKMLTRQSNTDYGLGVVVAGQGSNLYFWKSGHNQGYQSFIIMFPNAGKGLAVMTNSDSGNFVIQSLLYMVSKQYHWPDYYPLFD
ncbi:serine hydrolase domain-containing protein [Facilibium subflavum]|uniref:serine hydrolase domain-containing protein n=1 Tax=Facilibium subflavum TaxID=2219058 RepID=UPI000E655E92|nr:serine hydrolase domain-containing protein [Facilibium subflavum]